jgi:hypothetical protein
VNLELKTSNILIEKNIFLGITESTTSAAKTTLIGELFSNVIFLYGIS